MYFNHIYKQQLVSTLLIWHFVMLIRVKESIDHWSVVGKNNCGICLTIIVKKERILSISQTYEKEIIEKRETFEYHNRIGVLGRDKADFSIFVFLCSIIHFQL